MLVSSLSKPVKAGSKNLSTEVESIVLIGMEKRPVQTRKQPKGMLANSVTSLMHEVISPSKCLTETRLAYLGKRCLTVLISRKKKNP